MAKAIIQFAYRQIINARSTSSWEKAVWAASYNEFLLKSQAYNQEGKFTTFTQLKANDGRANSLHYKSGFAVAGFIASLKNVMPDVTTSFGKSLLFDTHDFEVIETDVTNQLVHEVAVLYYSKPLLLLEVIGQQVLVCYKNETSYSSKLINTFLLSLEPNCSISSYQLL